LVAIFAERCLRHDTSRWLPLGLAPLVSMAADKTPLVAKTIVQTVATILPLVLRSFAGEARTWTDLHQSAWNAWLRLKSSTLRDMESASEPVRSAVLKLMEVIVITNTCTGSNRNIIASQQQQSSSTSTTTAASVRLRAEPFAQSDLPHDHPSMNIAQLNMEADEILQRLVDLAQSGKLTATNQSVAISCISSLARSRPQYIDRLVPVLLRIPQSSSSMPDTQLRRMNFVLKTQLVSLLKSRAAEDYWSTITDTLNSMPHQYHLSLLSHLYDGS
jgi:hypothetical protein